MSNELVIWDDAKLQEIKKLFAPDLTNNEFQIFCQIGKSTGLNPFLRELWAVKYKDGPASIFVGRDGYRKSAQSSPLYDWHMVEAIYENDEFSGKNGEYTHTFRMKDRGKIVGAYALCQRKGSSRPNYVRVDMSEYNTGRSVWAQKPSTMIKKVAEAQVLRMTFQELFAGTYDESEQWDDDRKEQPANKAKSPQKRVIDMTPETDEAPVDPGVLYEEYLSRLSKIKSIDELSAIFEEIKTVKSQLGKEYVNDLIDRIKSMKKDLESIDKKEKAEVAHAPVQETPPIPPTPVVEKVETSPTPSETTEEIPVEESPKETFHPDDEAVKEAESIDTFNDFIAKIRATKDESELEEVWLEVDTALAQGKINLQQHGVLASHKGIRQKKFPN